MEKSRSCYSYSKTSNNNLAGGGKNEYRGGPGGPGFGFCGPGDDLGDTRSSGYSLLLLGFESSKNFSIGRIPSQLQRHKIFCSSALQRTHQTTLGTIDFRNHLN